MFEDMGRGTPASLEEMSRHFEPWVTARLQDGRYLGWVTERAGEPVASAGLLIVDLPPVPHDPTGTERGYLLNVYVAPAFRRHGLARALVEETIREARRRHIRILALHASDKGRPLYESLGFHATNEMQLRFPDPA